MRESDVLLAVRDYLGICGFDVFRRNTGAMRGTHNGKARFVRFSSPGAADLWGIQRHTGRHLEVEVKAPGKRPSPAQLAWLAAMRRNRSIAFWCDSVERCREELTRALAE